MSAAGSWSPAMAAPMVVCSYRLIGETERAGELESVTVFEAKTVRTGVKRKRLEKGDPGDVDGYMGPWREYVDQIKVSKPSEKEQAILEEQSKHKQQKNKKEVEDTIEESSLLHGESCKSGESYSPTLLFPQPCRLTVRAFFHH